MLPRLTDIVPFPILEYIYPLKSAYCKRPVDKPMLVLALGLGRCGTESLRNALGELGYASPYHGWRVTAEAPEESIFWVRLARRKYNKSKIDGSDCMITREEFDQVLGNSQAVADMPCAFFARELIQAYPEAKVIVNYREDKDAWVKSSIDVFNGLRDSWDNWLTSFGNSELFWVRTLWHRYTLHHFFHGRLEHTAKWRYDEHYAMLRGLVPEERRLDWKVQDGWEPLCNFLGKPVPITEFPSGNATKDTLNKARAWRVNKRKAAILNLSLVGAVAIVLIAAILAFVFKRT